MNTAAPISAASVSTTPKPDALDNGYGRARLRLGIIGVGLWVLISATLLSIDSADAVRQELPAGPLGEVLLVALMLGVYVLIQFPLDWLGGYQVPRRYGRQPWPAGKYAHTLLRGITAHAAVLLVSFILLYLGGRFGGVIGALIAGLVWLVVLAAGRGLLARVVARLSPATATNHTPCVELLHSSDEGFTGGITGVISPKRNLLPAVWQIKLSPALFELVKARRQQVIRSGAWRAGRCGALAFTATGLLFALLLSGPDQAGTGVGVVETALWFTLWSFAGLLVLPTLSRAAIYRIDQQLIHDGIDPERFDQLTAALDRMQDGEPTRPRWVERVFHPIPSVANRQRRDRVSRFAFWDIARTSVYLGIAAGSLLTRSVHCNVGRPALWAWLPTE